MKYLKYLFYISIISLTTYSKPKQFHQKMIVASPVANLRGAPRNIPSDFKLPASSKTNPFQSTQLLCNEYVIAKQKFIDKENNAWYLVDAIQQPTKNQNGTWTGLTGWVQAQDLEEVEKFEEHNLVITNLFTTIYNNKNKKINILFIGTALTGTFDTEKNMYHITMPHGCCGWIKSSDVMTLSKHNELSESELRINIIKTAKKFLGNSYSWGGRTPETDLLPVSSIDCSGLTNLVFTAQGLLIPRNSGSQYQKATHIKHGKDLQAGDLIFFANNNHKISHVLFYSGDGKVIESSLTAGKVTETSFKKRIGFHHTTMKSGDLSGPIMTLESEKPTFFRVYFASFTSDKNMIQKLRHDFLQYHY